MKIIVLILFLSFLGALIGVDGLVFCLSVLLLLPALYFTFGVFFSSPFTAYLSFILVLSLLLVLYRRLVLKKKILINVEFFQLQSCAVFCLAYTFFYLLCARWPDFYSLGERMRDLALIGSGVSEPVLIQEPWMSGVGLNYYAYWYRFAHIIATVLHMPHWEVYHVLVAFAASSLLSASFIFLRDVLNLDLKTAAFLSSMLLLMSSPAGIVYFFLSDITWWYPSRVIQGTIHEFPAWSFLLGDAHPHFLNSGILIWFLFLSYQAFSNGVNQLSILLYALILPVLFFLNANMWEVPIWLALYCSAFFISIVLALIHRRFLATIRAVFSKINIPFLGSCLLLCVIAVCFYQMKVNFIPDSYPVKFIAGKFVSGEVYGSNPREFFLHWGFFIVPILLVQFLAIKEGKFFLFVAILISLFLQDILPFLLILFFINFLRLLNILKNQLKPSAQIIFCETIVFSALAFLIVPELIYLDDPYGGNDERMNTFFKISYVNWSLMFFSCVYLLKDLERVKQHLGKLSLPCFVVLTSFFFSVIPDRSGSRDVNSANSLRGLNTVETRYPGVKAVVEFLSNQAPGTILEAQGPPYSETTLVATLTGFPAYLGWINHIDLLLPTKRKEIQRRNSNLELVYNSLNCPERLSLLKQERISYLVVGDLEKKSYPNLSNTDFSCLKQILEEKNYKLFSIS